MYIIFENKSIIFKMETLTGTTYRLDSDKWVRIKESHA